jgi:hypothetical protein
VVLLESGLAFGLLMPLGLAPLPVVLPGLVVELVGPPELLPLAPAALPAPAPPPAPPAGDGHFRGEADMLLALGAYRSDENDPERPATVQRTIEVVSQLWPLGQVPAAASEPPAGLPWPL